MSELDLLLRQIADPSDLPWNEETYDLALARGVGGAERATLVAKLIEQGRLGDTRAILTLGHLQATEALPWIAEAARGYEPWAPTARRAMVLYGQGSEVVGRLVEDAAHAPAKMARVAAVLALGQIGGETAIAGLEQAVGDPAYEVRMLAWDGLVAAHGLEPRLRGPEGKRTKTTGLELLKDLLACDLPSLVQLGVGELRVLSRALRAGVSPDTLGIHWAPHPAPELRARLTAAAIDRDQAYPVDELAQLTGIARRWAEAALVMRLDQSDPDPRVPDALARLDARWTMPVLDEVLRTKPGSDELRDALGRALHALQAN